jgi:hypothetical protein
VKLPELDPHSERAHSINIVFSALHMVSPDWYDWSKLLFSAFYQLWPGRVLILVCSKFQLT